jgi:hypothetical protein
MPARAWHTGSVFQATPRRASSRFTLVLAWICVVSLAINLGRYASPVIPGMSAGQRPMARLPPPPSDFRTLLFQLGVGSVTWYIAVVAFPLLLLLARRVDAERLGRAGAVAVVAGGTLLLMSVTSAIDFAWTYRGATAPPPLGAWATISLRQHVLPWLALVGAVAAIEARRRALHARVERERLRAGVGRRGR